MSDWVTQLLRILYSSNSLFSLMVSMIKKRITTWSSIGAHSGIVNITAIVFLSVSIIKSFVFGDSVDGLHLAALGFVKM